MKYFIGLLSFLFVLGCKTGFEETVVVTPKPPNLEIQNKTNDPIVYILMEQGLAARTDFSNPCEDFQPNLPAKSTVNIPYEEIEGFDEDAELVWMLWTNCDGLNDSDTYRLF